MTPDEHYREAERLIGLVNDDESGDTMLTTTGLLALAQVHATLATVPNAIPPAAAPPTFDVAVPPKDVSLGRAVVQRRTELGLSQEEVADSGGPSVASLRTIEHESAEAYRPKTLTSLDRALGWPVGTSAGLLAAATVDGGAQ